MSDARQNNGMRTPDAREALIGRERIRGATRMFPEGMDATKVTAEQIVQLGDDVQVFLKAHGITKQQLAKAVGYSPSVVIEFLANKYAGNRGEVAIQLDAWLSEEESRRQRPATTQFVWTNVATEI